MSEMNEKMDFDGLMRNHFSERCEPPPEVRSLLNERLPAVSKRRDIRLCWAVTACAFFFSAAALYALSMLTDNGYLIFACAVYIAFSLFGSSALIFVCQINESLNIKNTGRNENAVSFY